MKKVFALMLAVLCLLILLSGAVGALVYGVL